MSNNDMGFDLNNNLPIGFNLIDVEAIAIASTPTPFGELHCLMIVVDGEQYICEESIGFDEFRCIVLAEYLTEQVEKHRSGLN